MSSQVGSYKQTSPNASPLEVASKSATRNSTQESSSSVFAEKLQQRRSADPKAKSEPQNTQHTSPKPSNSGDETAEPNPIPSRLEQPQDRESSTHDVQDEETASDTVELSFSPSVKAFPQVQPKRSIELGLPTSSPTTPDGSETALQTPAGFAAQFTTKANESHQPPEQVVSLEPTEIVDSTDSLNTSRQVAQSGLASQDLDLSETTNTDAHSEQLESEIPADTENASRQTDGGIRGDDQIAIGQSQSLQPNSSQPSSLQPSNSQPSSLQPSSLQSESSHANGPQNVVAPKTSVATGDHLAAASPLSEPGGREADTSRVEVKPVETSTTSSEPATPAVAGPTSNSSGEVAKPQSASTDANPRLQSLVDRVAEAVESAGRQQSTRPLRIRLDPPELGVLSIEVQTQGGQVSARLQVESSTAQRLLLDHLPQLQDALAQQTGGATQVEVSRSEPTNSDSQQQSYSQEQSTSQQQQQQQQQKRANSVGRSRVDGIEHPGEPQEDTSSPQRSSRSDALIGIDIEV